MSSVMKLSVYCVRFPMLRLVTLLFAAATLPVMAFAPAPIPKADKAGELEAALRQLSGVWLQTSVRYSGEEVHDSPNTGNSMKFDGVNFAEFSGSGRSVLTGQVKIVGVNKGVLQVDLPRKVFTGDRLRIVTVAAILRVRDNRMQIAYFDARSGVASPKRPDAFDSNPANRVILITMKPKP